MSANYFEMVQKSIYGQINYTDKQEDDKVDRVQC